MRVKNLIPDGAKVFREGETFLADKPLLMVFCGRNLVQSHHLHSFHKQVRSCGALGHAAGRLKVIL